MTDMVTIEQEPGDITQGRREELRSGGGAARQRALTSWWRLLCSREGEGEEEEHNRRGTHAVERWRIYRSRVEALLRKKPKLLMDGAFS